LSEYLKEAPAEFGRSCVMRAREAVRGYAELDRHAKFFLDAHLLAQCSCSSWAVSSAPSSRPLPLSRCSH